MSPEMLGQNKLSFAFRRHFSAPICPWSMSCNICGRRLLEITSRCPLRTRPFSTLRFSLKFQYSFKSCGHSVGYSGQPWCTTYLRRASTTSWSVHCRISSSLAGLAGNAACNCINFNQRHFVFLWGKIHVTDPAEGVGYRFYPECIWCLRHILPFSAKASAGVMKHTLWSSSICSLGAYGLFRWQTFFQKHSGWTSLVTSNQQVALFLCCCIATQSLLTTDLHSTLAYHLVSAHTNAFQTYIWLDQVVFLWVVVH